MPITSKVTPSHPVEPEQVHRREVIGAFVICPASQLLAVILHCPFPIYNATTSPKIIRF